jgi:hypothetical protein
LVILTNDYSGRRRPSRGLLQESGSRSADLEVLRRLLAAVAGDFKLNALFSLRVLNPARSTAGNVDKYARAGRHRQLLVARSFELCA